MSGRRSLRQAFDEIEFGPSHTINLREGLPTAAQAVARCEAWLRERQMARAGEVLVITGAGRGSVDGVPVIREAVRKLLTALSRRGVVHAVREHSPGSYAVRLAPITALFDGGRRRWKRWSARPSSCSGTWPRAPSSAWVPPAWPRRTWPTR